MENKEKIELFNSIEGAIHDHGLWKERLVQAISDGSSHWTPDFVEPCDNCDFGQWLEDLPEHQRGEHFDGVYKAHKQFHVAAAEVLKYALQKDKETARRMVEPGSAYCDLTADLVVRAGMWMKSIR